jgi:hypothetical protein
LLRAVFEGFWVLIADLRSEIMLLVRFGVVDRNILELEDPGFIDFEH